MVTALREYASITSVVSEKNPKRIITKFASKELDPLGYILLADTVCLSSSVFA